MIDPENVMPSTIDYICKCINDDEVEVLVVWDTVSLMNMSIYMYTL